jgi:hypothetical protein
MLKKCPFLVESFITIGSFDYDCTLGLFSEMTANESKLPKITNQFVHVFESCNENAKSIQSFNSTILKFIRQFQSIPTSLGSLDLGGHISTLDYNVAIMVDFNTLLERKGKKLGSKV